MSGDLIILSVVLCLFLVVSIFLLMGKGSFFIAGYNTASAESKSKYNEEKLTKFMGKLMLLLSFCMLFWIFDCVYNSKLAFYIGLILFLFISAGGVIYMNTSEKFKK
ncbi:DUF3784 domain-containing protein [Bacillus sp. REN10]|uniref:DUF3784 domain-containing protein n=1 Tax=Bacillus sp. REN10 TaxID=2782541 RepID=UPI00193B3CDE|nr:DUF3784 domain-containing protein [Bacillus sp. REN10]